jgi:hypothetical protein
MKMLEVGILEQETHGRINMYRIDRGSDKGHVRRQTNRTLGSREDIGFSLGRLVGAEEHNMKLASGYVFP